MTTTTSYGTWCNQIDQYATSLEHSATEAFGAEGADDFDFDAITADWRQAINDALPDGVVLAGDEFIGPAYDADCDFDGYPADEDGSLDLKAIVDGIDFWEIAARHELWTLDLVADHLGSKAKDPAKSASRALSRLGVKAARFRPHPDSGRPQALYRAREVEQATAQRLGQGARTDLTN